MTVLVTCVILWLWGGPAVRGPSGKQLPPQNAPTTLSHNRVHHPQPQAVTPVVPRNSELNDDVAAGSADVDGQAHVVILRNAEDYQRLRDWATANDFHLAGEIPHLHALKFILNSDEYEYFLRNSGVDATEETDALVCIPDQLLDKYPEWTGYPGSAFGNEYRNYLGVDTTDTERGHGVTIAMLDTPIFPHLAIENAQITLLGDQTDTQQTDIADHGTAVASILTGANGISNAKILAYGVLDAETGNGSAFDLAAAIVDAVDRGVDVISMSLGTYSNASVLQDAVNYALAHQVLLVASAGNNGVEDVCYPAAYEGVLAVGAIDANGNVSGFSNYGDSLALVAPGVGLQAATFDDEYQFFSGTSAAVPCVSAVLANYLSANPAITPAEAYARLLQNCTDTEEPGFDAISGYGILDAERLAEQDEHGIYDAAAAGITLDDATDTLTVAAQNTGTETIGKLVLTTEIHGVELVNEFEDVAPGTIVSAQGNLPDDIWKTTDTLTIRTTVSTPDVADVRQRNQTHRQTFEAPVPADQ